MPSPTMAELSSLLVSVPQEETHTKVMEQQLLTQSHSYL